LHAGGVPQRDRRLGVLPKVLPGPQPNPHRPAVCVYAVAVQAGHGVDSGVQPGAVLVGLGALDREAGCCAALKVPMSAAAGMPMLAA
jgi:hypothetical protein